MVEEQRPKVKIFISCAPEDEKYRKQLSAHLSPQKRRKLITTWFKGKILPGSNCELEIEKHLNSADIILQLVSSDFMHSDECNVEMQHAQERGTANEATVIPVIVRPCMWSLESFSKRNVLPTNRKAISKWSNPDAAWTDVAGDIYKEVSRIRLSQISSPALPFSSNLSMFSHNQDNSLLVSSDSHNEPVVVQAYQSSEGVSFSPDPSVSTYIVVSTKPSDEPVVVQAYQPTEGVSVSVSPNLSKPTYSVVSTKPSDEPVVVQAYQPTEGVSVSPDPSVSIYREDTTDWHWVVWIILIVVESHKVVPGCFWQSLIKSCLYHLQYCRLT